jgi:hypothetical protein
VQRAGVTIAFVLAACKRSYDSSKRVLAEIDYSAHTSSAVRVIDMISHTLDDKSTIQGRGILLKFWLRSRNALRPRSWIVSVIAAPAFDLELLSWIAPTAERHLNHYFSDLSYIVRSRKIDQHVLPWAPAALRVSEQTSIS